MVEEFNYPGENPGEVSDNPAVSKKERPGQIFFIALIFICLISLVWGGWQLLEKIRAPFPVLSNTNNTNSNINISDDLAEVLALQKQDSDNDGLSDYDELYVYQTSPYLEDSDSDNFKDKEEITTGHDPNCPAGQNCDWTPFSQQAQEQDSGLAATSDFSNILQGAATATQLRQTLLSAGMSADELNQLDDTTLMEIYYQVLSDNQSDNQTDITTNTGLTQEQIDYLNNLSADEIRELFKEMDINEETLAALEQVDDATLRAMFQQALVEQSSE